ncbi:hypothetical protein CXB51_023632 [Gossypium anomalum]|uniref:Phytocyanin domain-containing protein n=1 Tax=Gossypium anomalum TaxID=47600 RepID=A0A8J5YGF7_9ROSI|nr:hypothetical protein CXB51_023632 [Gossypium anomalum]
MMRNFFISKVQVNLSLMVMTKLILLCFLSIFCFALTSHAATYVVGDTSGWDISSDIVSWASSKTFNVGDVLLFQYSSSHSVNEVRKESFETCSTINILRKFSNGNTTVILSNSGIRYFVCGNKLHCLGGMKLKVDVDEKSTTVGAPQAQSEGAATLQQPSSKSNNLSTVIPTSTGYINGGFQSQLIASICLTAAMLLEINVGI